MVGRRARHVRGRALHATSSSSTASRRNVGYIGSGYLEPYLTNAGIKTVTAPDPLTLVVTTEFPTTLLTQAYVPILPKHIWSKYTLDQIADSEAAGFFKNEPKIVGTGPYQVVEWEPGSFVRFEANPNYWGKKGAANEVDHPALREHGHDGPGAAAR